jgi:hypothetical protein
MTLRELTAKLHEIEDELEGEDSNIVILSTGYDVERYTDNKITEIRRSKIGKDILIYIEVIR